MAPAPEPVDPLASFRLDGKVAVVTGASSGIGARFAEVIDALGATVVVSARRTERIEALAGPWTEAPPPLSSRPSSSATNGSTS